MSLLRILKRILPRKLNKQMIFNIYYINFAKVYEIKMMISNIISTGRNIETGDNTQISANLHASTEFNLLAAKGKVGSDIQGESKGSKKIIETFEVKTTKSVILSEVINYSETVNSLANAIEGQLLKIDNVHLELINETELRTAKLLSNGTFKGIVVPGANGFDINNLFNSMFKDYSYKLEGRVERFNERIIIKIPLTFENEFESSYSVDDMAIGKVSIVGIYKGKVNASDLKNSFEYFAELGNSQKQDTHEFHNSQYDSPKITVKIGNINHDTKEYHYIDLLAIIQNVQIPVKDEK